MDAFYSAKPNNRKTGARYEERAASYLNENGVNILDKNFKSYLGEVDLIGKDGDYIVFFEVKSRRNLKTGYPEEAVTPLKQNKIRKTALYYLQYNKIPATSKIRFDVISILNGDIKWLKNAF